MGERPLLLVDIDGVLNVYGVDACPEGFVEYDIFAEDDEPTRLSMEHARWLRELSTSFDLVWASAWGFEAHERLGPILQLDRFPFVPMPAIPFPPREKVPAIAEYVCERAVAWVDDVSMPEAISWAESRAAPTLLVFTDHTRGLERSHVDELLRWADELP